MTETLLFLAALVIMFVGLLGSILPIVPGPPLIWLGALVYGWATNFQIVGWGTLTLLGIIGIIAATSDVWMSSLGNKTSGESLLTTLTSLIGGIIGLIVLNLPGMLIGSIIGILLPNWRRLREQGYVFNISWRVVKNWLLGSLIQTTLGVIMIIIFLVRVFTA